MIMEVQTLYVLLRSNALLARSNFHDYCRSNDLLVHATIAASGILLCGVAVLLYRYSNHERCQRLKRYIELVFSFGSGSLENRSARSIQSVWRCYVQRRPYVKRHQASVVIQSRIRGIIVRSILCGQGLPTLARAVVQEDGVQQRAADSNKGTTPNVHEDCRNLIAAFNQEEEEEESQASSANATKDQSSMMFGTQVKAVMEVRMRLLAAVVLQSWFRMIKCRIGYRRIFSSLNTAPITNMPSIASARRQDTQEGISFISSLSSWSSTWNRLQPPMLASTPFFAADSSSNVLTFGPTTEEKEALKHSIKDYASAYASIVQLQAWWRGSMARLRLHRGASKGLEEEAQQENKTANSGSENTVRTSNMSISKNDCPDKDKHKKEQHKKERPRKPSPAPRGRPSRNNGSRRRRRRSNQYYSDMWQSTLERVGECQTMCSAVIDTAASMEFTKKAATVGRTICEDPTNYDVIMKRAGEAADEIPACTSVPSMVAEAGNKHIDEGGCKWEQELLNSTKSSAMEIVDQITTWRRKTRRKKGTSSKNDRSRDGHLYYVPTDMIDVEPLSTGFVSSSAAFSSPAPSPQNTLSSPASSYTNPYGTDEETSHQSSEAKSRKARRQDPLVRALCAAPVPTSMMTSSSESSSDSRDVESYYSIDDGDVRDDEEAEDDDDDDSKSRYAAANDGSKSARKPSRRDSRRYSIYDDDDSNFSLTSFLQI